MERNGLAVVGAFFIGLLMWALRMFVFGVVLMFFWNWFIAPLGVPQIGYWLALGINMTVNAFMLNMKKEDYQEAKDNSFAGILIYNVGYIIGVLLAWGIGAIVHLFV